MWMNLWSVEKNPKGRAGAMGERKRRLYVPSSSPKRGKVKRFYGLQIKDFSAKSLRPIFERHIAKDAKVTTDEWKGYRPIAKDFYITQIPSEFGLNFKALHTAIHQVKSWIRTTFSWVSKPHFDRYLSEYSFRLNRSQIKPGIFHNLIGRMVNSDKIYINNLV